MKNRGVIIGSGLGGLACGSILARNGFEVTILEQASQLGGCLQCFTRNGAKFDTGMHFIGSAAPGQTLWQMMHFLGIMPGVCLEQLDTSGYDVIDLEGQLFRFPNGRERLIEQMAAYFPKQRDNLNRYYDAVEQVATASSLHSLRYADIDAAINPEYLLRPIDDVLGSIITDPMLANVLMGSLPLYAAERGKTPFATHAFIMDFYNQGAFRIVGGSDTIVKAMVPHLETMGVRLLTRRKAVKIECDDSRATAVITATGERFEADYVIADIHPMRTMELLADNHLIRPAYKRRINSMPQTVGAFTVYLEFKEGAMPYMNHNLYAYDTPSPWGCETYDEESWPKGLLYMHFCHEPQPQWARSGTLLTYMNMSDVAQWVGTAIGRRGEDYEEFKRRKAEKLIDAAERHVPGLRSSILRYHTSTPLTYLDYTGTQDGSMYGIAKDATQPAASRVSHRTRIPNLLLTGQNTNSHGILGVIVGAVVTSSDLVPAETIYQQIRQAI